jgi:hypothetical protein
MTLRKRACCSVVGGFASISLEVDSGRSPNASQHHFIFLRTLNLRVSAAGVFFSVTAAGFEGWDFGGFVSTLLTDEAYRSLMPTIVEPDGASVVPRSVLCGS